MHWLWRSVWPWLWTRTSEPWCDSGYNRYPGFVYGLYVLLGWLSQNCCCWTLRIQGIHWKLGYPALGRLASLGLVMDLKVTSKDRLLSTLKPYVTTKRTGSGPKIQWCIMVLPLKILILVQGTLHLFVLQQIQDTCVMIHDWWILCGQNTCRTHHDPSISEQIPFSYGSWNVAIRKKHCFCCLCSTTSPNLAQLPFIHYRDSWLQTQIVFIEFHWNVQFSVQLSTLTK